MRGNGKIIQELEAEFSGAGWNVIKVVWGAYWDPLIAQDKNSLLLKRMEEAVDGEYQSSSAGTAPTCARTSSASTPSCARWSRRCSDADIWRLNRGGHDPHKVYAAYESAMNTRGSRR